MRTYTYKAKNGQGAVTAGRLGGYSRVEVINSLKQKGYYLLSVERLGRISAILSLNESLTARVGVNDKAMFTGQLAILLKAGVKLTKALETLSKQSHNKYFGSVIGQLKGDVEQSSSLSEAMSRHRRIFSQVYTSIVGACEQTGKLSETLFMLGRQLKKQAAVRSRIRSAMVYPVFLLAVSSVVVGVLAVFVVPKFIELFVNADQQLPLATKILVMATDIFRRLWWAGIVGSAGAVSLFMAGLKNRDFKGWFDSVMLGVPLAGEVNRKILVGRFSRTLGSLLDGGVVIVEAIRITKGTVTNSAFAKQISCIEQRILKGVTLAEAIGEQRYFDQMAVNMISVGEETGTLGEMLGEVAQMYESESESSINSVTSLLGPIMIVVLGLVIGFIVMAILMPIFETSSMVG